MTCSSESELLLGIDTGGTFTDFVLVAPGKPVRTHKLLSTPVAPARAILQGIADLGLRDAMHEGRLRIVHGTTIATNAALQRKGVRTALVCNEGFRDLLSIGRQARSSLYALQLPPRLPPLPREHCLEINVRCDAQGGVLQELQAGAVDALRQKLQALGAEAVAINLLFSHINDEHEQAIETALQSEFFCSRSSFVLPESGEYERGIATWLNAWLGPLVARYLLELDDTIAPSHFSVMQSSGSSIAARQASRRAVNLLLSGPAGGVRAATLVGSSNGSPKLITFDMGGTSTDVALINEQPELTREGQIGDWPLAVPMLDIHTIGAGGGSIACLDAGGLLRVGPESAGADPGPACYGCGGTQPTVTDANLVLGRLLPDEFLGGRMQLDLEAARAAIAALAEQAGLSETETAKGIVDVANEHMADALRLISLGRGHDPADYSLCCFGGAGGLHVFALAEALGMQRILLPAHAGVLSALGMLATAPGRQLTRACSLIFDGQAAPRIEQALDLLQQQAHSELAEEGVDLSSLHARPFLELRYHGQRHTLGVPWTNFAAARDAFQQQHELAYGHQLGAELELVSVRLELTGPVPMQEPPPHQPEPDQHTVRHVAMPGRTGLVPVIRRTSLHSGQSVRGPVLLVEHSTTIWVHPDWQLHCDPHGNLHGACEPHISH